MQAVALPPFVSLAQGAAPRPIRVDSRPFAVISFIWHSKQVLTYLRLLNLPLGLLINFGAPTFKDGRKHIGNGPLSFVPSHLRVNQNQGLAAYEQ